MVPVTQDGSREIASKGEICSGMMADFGSSLGTVMIVHRGGSQTVNVGYRSSLPVAEHRVILLGSPVPYGSVQVSGQNSRSKPTSAVYRNEWAKEQTHAHFRFPRI